MYPIKRSNDTPIELALISNFLQQDFHGFTKEDLFIMQFVPKAWGQDIAALSNMAEALMTLWKCGRLGLTEAAIYITRVADCAMHSTVRPFSKPLDQQQDLGRYGYYLEHLNIILGCYQTISDDRFFKLNKRITEHLVALTLAESNLHAPLLPHVRMRWSADQAAIIYSVWLFDQNNNTKLATKLIDPWLSYMRAYRTENATGLFQTEALGVKAYSNQPRGCSLAYLIYYMSHFAPRDAKTQWERFKEHMFQRRLGIWGFREYLRGYNGKWTPDSGPIFMGTGIAATGLALKTAAAMQDNDTFERINRPATSIIKLMRAMQCIPLLHRLARLGTDLLATSIKLSADALHLKYTGESL
ncbi:MAG: hypothetical protein P8O79_14240 [Halieaceae bacterium]|nr:hypothetical protein [Halieaceae bacterium]